MHELPVSRSLNIAALSGLFNSRTNSYKYLYFLSIIDILRRRDFSVNEPISLKEIFTEMLVMAWYPHYYFKLSFGSQDKIAKILKDLDIKTDTNIKFTPKFKKELRESIVSQDITKIIRFFKKDVPFRLIRPFLVDKLEKFDVNYEVVRRTPEIARNCFDKYKPLYRFNDIDFKNIDSIILHEEWINYLRINNKIVESWAFWEWLKYMQLKNPTTPNIINKLFIPKSRGSLSSETKFWKSVLKYESLHCIYSNQILDPEHLSLDHYLPWSFVAHDQLWNLVPVVPEINSSKSNNLPSDRYFPEFVRLQYTALTINHKHLPKADWNKAIDVYISDLKLDIKGLLNYERLFNAYEATIKPLKTLATQQGFTPNWIWRGN